MPLRFDSEVSVPAHLFKQYDIRGVVPDQLSSEVATLIGQAFGTECRARSMREVLVAGDARLSTPELKASLTLGLTSVGCDVIDLGQVPTPVLYFATHHSAAGCGLMVTASHNPPEYNGIKMVLGHEAIYGESVQNLYRRVCQGELDERSPGSVRTHLATEAYASAIWKDVHLSRPLRVVLDCANAVAGAVAPQVLRACGCEVIELYCNVDGRFPNHPGDPTRPENLKDLIATVIDRGADVGLALDGDGDRLVAVSPTGEIIWPDRLMILFVEDILRHNPGGNVIFDVKCMRALGDAIVRFGGEPVMWKTGHSLIRAKLIECDGIFGGEMSGHLFFRDRWPGFDDGIYAAARLCELLSTAQMSVKEVFEQLPTSVSTPEIRIACESPHLVVQQFIEQVNFPGAKLTTIDGLRVTFKDGFGLIRASNTAAEIVLRFDADSSEALSTIRGEFIAVLNSLGPNLVQVVELGEL